MLEHEKWLAYAKLDYKSAKSLLRDELYSTATYHCQQAAEKSLKGYLVSRQQPILKTHDLIKLGTLCTLLDKDFHKLDSTLESLNPFATKFRYPSEFDIPDLEKTVQTVKQAEAVMNFVLQKIAIPQTGQLEIG